MCLQNFDSIFWVQEVHCTRNTIHLTLCARLAFQKPSKFCDTTLILKGSLLFQIVVMLLSIWLLSLTKIYTEHKQKRNISKITGFLRFWWNFTKYDFLIVFCFRLVKMRHKTANYVNMSEMLVSMRHKRQITVNRSEMWCAKHTKMQKLTSLFLSCKNLLTVIADS